MDRLAELRERHALTLRELAEMSGVAADTINQIELGHRKARPSTLRKLARALGVKVEEFYTEPALAGKAKAPRGAGQPETSAQNVEEFERALAHVLEPVRAEALREQRAASRAIASEGIPQVSIGDIAEEEVGKRFLDAFSPDERSRAFGEVALGYARLERANVNLEANYTRAQGLLRERDEKNAQLEAKIARLEQVEEGNAPEAEREAAR